MTIVQHLSSGGQTFYNPLLGAVLITITLKLLQIGISSWTKLSKRGYALTYFPSFLLLTIVSDIRPTATGVTLGSWLWIAPLLLILYAIIVIMTKRFEPYEPELRSFGIFSQLTWVSLAIFLSFFLFTGLFSNTDKYYHQRAKVEALIDKRDYAGALQVVKTMPHTDSVTSMLTVYAVARRGHLADKGRALRPGRVHSWLQPDSVLLKVTRTSANYQLIGFLLDRNLHDFARYLPQYYPVDSLRPRYYKEAYDLYVLRQKRLTPNKPYKKGSYTAYYFSK